jgi:predicted transcriptional regulator
MISLEKLVDVSKPAYEITSTPIVSCTNSETIRNTVAMTLNGFSRIMVTDRGKTSGFVTTLDILDFLGGGSKYQLYVRYKKGLDLPVDTIMDRDWHPLDKSHSIKDALGIFHKHGRDFHPIFHKDKFSGLISEMDIIRHLKGKTGIKATDIMDKKPIIAKDNYSVLDVSEMLCKGEYRFLPVVKDGFILGMITPRDVITYLNSGPGLNNLRKAGFEATAAMNRNFLSVEPESDLCEAVNIMNSKNINSVPVTDESEMLGLITRRDVIEALN